MQCAVVISRLVKQRHSPATHYNFPTLSTALFAHQNSIFLNLGKGMWLYLFAAVDDKIIHCFMLLLLPLIVGLVLDNSNGVSAVNIRFNLNRWLRRSLLKSRCGQFARAILTLPWPNFLVTKRYKWEHEIWLKLAIPACPAALPHHTQRELFLKCTSGVHHPVRNPFCLCSALIF